MAILNLEYYTQKDLYSDGDIEEQMLKMAKVFQEIVISVKVPQM